MFGREQSRERRRQRHIDDLLIAVQSRDVVADVEGHSLDLGVEERCQAIRKLAGIDDPRAVEAVADAGIYDRDPRVRGEAGQALLGLLRNWSELGERHERSEEASETGWLAVGSGAAGPKQVARTLLLMDDRDLLDEAGELLCTVLAGDGKADFQRVAFVEMVAGLTDPRPGVVDRVETLLVRYGRAHVEELLGLLGDPQRAARVALVLGQIKDNRALDPLRAALSAGEPQIRRACAWSLGQLADPRAVPDLLAAASDSDYEVRKLALASLDELGSAAVVFGVARATSAFGELGSGSSTVLEEPPSAHKSLAAAEPVELPQADLRSARSSSGGLHRLKRRARRS